MREIKFRAWHPGTKEMEYDRFIIFSNEGKYRLDDYDNCCEFPEPIIMQYTGLNDKYNTPIFEGDILGGIGVVVWIPEEARFGIECVGEIHEITFEELQQSQMEIIGNIYDNPEMVEEYK